MIAAGLRLWQAGESLWLDELHTGWAAGASLAEVAPRAAIGNQSPLFFWLEWLLLRLFGNSELALRLPSIIASSLLPLALYWLLASWNERGAGLLAAVLVAMEPAAISVGNEARPYALVQLVAVVHVAITVQLLSAPTKKLHACWIGLAVLLFYLHYTAALLIAAEAAFVAAIWLVQPQGISVRLRPLVADYFVVVLLCLCAGGQLAAIFDRRTNWNLFVRHAPYQQMFAWWPLALSGLYLAGALAAQNVAIGPGRRDERDKPGSRIGKLLCLFWLFVPPAIAWTLSETNVARLFHARYLAVAAPAAFTAAGLAMTLAPGVCARWLVALLLVTASLTSDGIVEHFFCDGRPIAQRREDWRSAVAWLNTQFPGHELPVLVYSGLIEADALTQEHGALLDDYCLLPVISLYPIAAERRDLFPLPFNEPGRLSAQLSTEIDHCGGAWLIVRGNENLCRQIARQTIVTLQRERPGEEKTQWQPGELHSFGHVQVVRIRR